MCFLGPSISGKTEQELNEKNTCSKKTLVCIELGVARALKDIKFCFSHRQTCQQELLDVNIRGVTIHFNNVSIHTIICV